MSQYFSKEDAERAILELDNTLLGGQRVRVSGRPEIFSRRPARSRSPEGRARSPRQWSNDDRRDMHPNDYYHLRTNDYEYYHRGSSPPAYHYESPAYRYYSQYRFPARHRSPHCALDEAGMASSHSYLATGVDHEPEQYEEQYDYASRGLTLEAWKYDYDHVVGHITDQWNAPCEQVPGSQQPNNF
ncbi:hypothetical protein D9615_000304 [Tricholomella constricta]|uniref:Uncharacterized protein n=1 Tax=Tricholomella constricta TaxID=117010 RepID=A0A8H5HR62_9AGAR|nr:hypothetical protein D9615_000304 [Tricholomella constricta]